MNINKHISLVMPGPGSRPGSRVGYNTDNDIKLIFQHSGLKAQVSYCVLQGVSCLIEKTDYREK